MSCISIVHEALSSVNEQLERRTYNAFSLKNVLEDLKISYSKLRLTNLASTLLQSYYGIVNSISISDIENGNATIFEVLAIDTLNFAKSAQDSLQHELRCQQIVNKDIYLKDGRIPSLQNTWRELSDTKWKDLHSIAVAIENYAVVSSEATHNVRREMNGDKTRKRRPLLLYFPYHMSSVNLCCHRTLLLMKRLDIYTITPSFVF